MRPQSSESQKIERKNFELKNFFLTERMLPILIFIVLCLLIGTFNSSFFLYQTWQNIFMQVANIGIIALGAMFVITSGGLDFTSGNGVSLCGIVAATVFVNYGMDNTLTWLAGLLVGAFIGAVNGFIIVKLRIQPFIATLSMMTIVYGVNLFVAEGSIINMDVPEANFTQFGQGIIPFPGSLGVGPDGSTQGIPIAFLIFILIALISALLLHKTRFGRAVLAMGGNENAARLIGVRVDYYRFWVYVFAGLCTGAAAMITLARVATVWLTIGGTSLLMDAVAAAIIGGTSVSGGKCSVLGVVIGALIIITISSALVYLNVDTNWRDVVKGMLIIFALCLDRTANRVRQNQIRKNAS